VLSAQMTEIAEEKSKLMEDKASKIFIPTHKANQSPLINIDIDRIALDKAGVGQEDVDRIYRALYTGSIGMYDNLKYALNKIPRGEQATVLGNLWKAY